MNTKQVKQDTLRFLGSFILKHSLDALCKTLRITYKNKKTIDDLKGQVSKLKKTLEKQANRGFLDRLSNKKVSLDDD